jgi:hypothetical protein
MVPDSSAVSGMTLAAPDPVAVTHQSGAPIRCQPRITETNRVHLVSAGMQKRTLRSLPGSHTQDPLFR